ncbi:hypothetical protein ACI77I_24775 [Pseudomonas sp. D47]|uniref:hypothetical protein n=1 Tax=Pseudomonas sp. D47 TaxID=3159447 RepID=UPI00387AA885
MELVPDHGGVGVALIAASSTLQISIIVSCVLFIFRIRGAKYLAYAQIPFRLLLLTPSISIILIAAHFTPGYSIIYLVLIIISEAVKGWSLWKYAGTPTS